MRLSALEVAQLIDISAVQAFHGKTEIDELIDAARRYRFKSVHVLPSWVSYLASEIGDLDDVLVGGPVGFPSGGHRTEVKLHEAELLVADGIDEMDLMINVGKLRSGDYQYVENEISLIVEHVAPVPLKVIIETAHLTDGEIGHAARICVESGAEYVKTSTGWTTDGAKPEVIDVIRASVGSSIKIKASGGIRNLETLVDMYRRGVSRFGINLNASVRIVEELMSQDKKGDENDD